MKIYTVLRNFIDSEMYSEICLVTPNKQDAEEYIKSEKNGMIIGYDNWDFEIEEHEVTIPIYVIVTKQPIEELFGDDEEEMFISVKIFEDAYLDKEKALKLKDGYLEAEIIEVKG